MHDDRYIWANRDTNALNTVVRYIGDGSPQTWNHYQAVHLKGAVTVDVSDRFALVASPRVDAFRFTQPRPLTQWQFRADVGVRGRF